MSIGVAFDLRLKVSSSIDDIVQLELNCFKSAKIILNQRCRIGWNRVGIRELTRRDCTDVFEIIACSFEDVYGDAFHTVCSSTTDHLELNKCIGSLDDEAYCPDGCSNDKDIE